MSYDKAYEPPPEEDEDNEVRTNCTVCWVVFTALLVSIGWLVAINFVLNCR
jgi:hypothetical protein